MNRDLVYSAWDIYSNNFASKPIQSQQVNTPQLFANLYCSGENYHYVIDAANPSDFYMMSPQVEQILGVKDHTTFTLGEWFDRIHPEDIDFMTACEKKILDFCFNRIEGEAILNYKFVYQIRLRAKKDKYVRILHQAVTISTDAFGRLSKVLSIDTVIDHLVNSYSRQLSILGMNGAPSYLAIDVFKDNNYIASKPNITFTKRELDVIRLFAEGKTAKEIAKLLHLAIGTIRTHRQNILKKAALPNMTAVVARSIREGLI